MKWIEACCCGVKEYKNVKIEEYIPENVSEIISGGAKGVDTLAEEFADKNKLTKHIIRPNYKKYTGKSAPIIRNKQIIQEADVVLALWDGQSKGTEFSINYAKKLNKEVVVVVKK